MHRDVQIDAPHGGWLRQRFLPLERVGICVPGGAAAYPSTVLMTAVPAQAAGVNQIVVVSPPTPNGAYNSGGKLPQEEWLQTFRRELTERFIDDELE